MTVEGPKIKVTEFVGEASGDCECFCFDRRTREQLAIEQASDDPELYERDEAARIYPHALLPDESYESTRGHSRGVRGRYRVTVEFWPEGT